MEGCTRASGSRPAWVINNVNITALRLLLRPEGGQQEGAPGPHSLRISQPETLETGERSPFSALKASNTVSFWPRLLKLFVHFQTCDHSHLLKVFLAKGLLTQNTGSNCGDKKLVLTVRRGEATTISGSPELGALSDCKEKGPSLPHPAAPSFPSHSLAQLLREENKTNDVKN